MLPTVLCCVNKKQNILLHNFITLRDTESCTRGHHLKIFKGRCRLNIKQNSFIHRCTDVWNSLPQSVVEAPSVQSFEGKLDKLWKNHPIKLDYTTSPLLWNNSSDACAPYSLTTNIRAGVRGITA